MGPVTNVVHSLANTFANLGEDVTLLDAKNSRDRTLSEKVSVVELDAPGYPIHQQWPILQEFAKEAGKLELSDYDIIHVHNGRLANLLQKNHNVKCVFTIHGPIWCNKFLYTGLKGRLRWLRNQLEILFGVHQVNIIRKTALSVALGEFVKQIVTSNNIVVIRNGISLDKWPIIDRNQARTELGYRESDFALVFVASIRQVKGLNVLIEAVRLIAPQIPNLRVIIMGQHAETIFAEARGLPMEFTGFIPNGSYTFKRHMAAADVLVVPSLFDNQPTVALEGLCMGLPVIGSRVGGIPDMINEDVGLLFEPGNSKELADNIRFLHTNTEVRARMSKAARPHVKSHFSWASCAEKYLQAFDNVLAHKK